MKTWTWLASTPHASMNAWVMSAGELFGLMESRDRVFYDTVVD
jgi:hypothetical protein